MVKNKFHVSTGLETFLSATALQAKNSLNIASVTFMFDQVFSAKDVPLWRFIRG